jgi:hypothetical protein
MNDLDYPFYPSSGFALITQHISYQVVPERVLALAALNAVPINIRYILTFGTKLL